MKWALAACFILICFTLGNYLSDPYRAVKNKITDLPNGNSIKTVRIENSNNHLNPYDTSQRIDNIIFDITITENCLNDAEIQRLGEDIQGLLDAELDVHTNAENGNWIRINLSISPVSETYVPTGEKADGISYYRTFNFDTQSFEWESHAFFWLP